MIYMIRFDGTKTEKNLKKALQGEALARIKYEFYAKQAKKDGFIQIQNILNEISNNEKEHAKIWFKILNNDNIPSTLSNLMDSEIQECYEYSDMYKTFAKEASDEGFDDISQKFLQIADIEKSHASTFENLINQIKYKTVFSNNKKTIWTCLNCGYKEENKEAPDECPVCNHPKAYFTKD